MEQDFSTPPARAWQSASRWILLLVLVSSVTWRAKAIYTGGVDVVVVGKALLAMIALASAWFARKRCRDPQPMGTLYLWLLSSYVAVSLFGAWTTGELIVNAVLSARVMILAATVALLVKTYSPSRLVRDLMVASTVVALVGSVTGVGSVLSGERLRGGIPEMHSNELSLVCALPAIGLLFLVVNGWARLGHVVLLVVMLSLVWATGSRTSLLAVGLAFVVLLLQARRLSPWLVAALVATVPVIAFVGLRTDVIDEFVNRGGQGRIGTLNSRSIVWEAALSYADTGWTLWFGSGLATKRIPVTGQFWDEQNLDSSWVSTLVQAGIIGVILLLGWLVTLAIRTFSLPRAPRSLVQALLVFLLVRSVVESGLVDSSPALLTLLLLSLVSDPGHQVPRPRVSRWSTREQVATRSLRDASTPLSHPSALLRRSAAAGPPTPLPG